jgi:hypothetical protein
MNLHDFDLLARKILIGVAITALPAIVVLTGLWATQTVLRTGGTPAKTPAVLQKGRP